MSNEGLEDNGSGDSPRHSDSIDDSAGMEFAMDAIALLKADHRAVEKLFKEFEKLVKKGGSDREKERVVRSIVKELSTHAAIEEKVFYPGIRKADEELGDQVLEAFEEHHLVKVLLSELDNMGPSDERYDAKVTVLTEIVRHHVEEEESEMFPELRKAVGRKALSEMGAELEKAKKRAPRKVLPYEAIDPALRSGLQPAPSPTRRSAQPKAAAPSSARSKPANPRSAVLKPATTRRARPRPAAAPRATRSRRMPATPA